jgi:CHAT domain-containing protein
VILSGCRSALGVYTRGEALSGLAQAFLAAKVPAVMASLWEVDDERTAELMQTFHYHHQAKKQGFSESLSHAQRSLIYAADPKRRHPYYWAAFLLAGDGLSVLPH